MKTDKKKVRPNCARPAPLDTDPAHAESRTATILPQTKSLVKQILECCAPARTESRTATILPPDGEADNTLEARCVICNCNLLFSASQPSSQILAAMCANCTQEGW